MKRVYAYGADSRLGPDEFKRRRLAQNTAQRRIVRAQADRYRAMPRHMAPP